MLLPSLISLRRSSADSLAPEDIFGSSLGGIFTDDLQNNHGDDPDTVIVYENAKYGPLEFRTADVNGEEQRRKFAHYLWNAGILMAEMVGGRPDSGSGRDSGFFEIADEEEGWQNGGWWVDHEEEKLWSVEGQTVLELGAGVGIGGILSAIAGAQEVVITDYPAAPIVDAITNNVSENISQSLCSKTANAHRYTRILAADCLWMPYEHDNLARSMLHFLSFAPDARILCIAGFHTGRAMVAAFFEDVIPEAGLEIEEIYELNADGVQRRWANERDCGTEDIGERKKWLVVARIRRPSS